MFIKQLNKFPQSLEKPSIVSMVSTSASGSSDVTVEELTEEQFDDLSTLIDEGVKSGAIAMFKN